MDDFEKGDRKTIFHRDSRCIAAVSIAGVLLFDKKLVQREPDENDEIARRNKIDKNKYI